MMNLIALITMNVIYQKGNTVFSWISHELSEHKRYNNIVKNKQVIFQQYSK